MDERLKKFLYMAVGLASTSEKVRTLLAKMEIEGRLTKEEGERIINELFNSGKGELAHLSDELKNSLNELMQEIQTPSIKEMNELKKRISELEAKLNKPSDHEI